MGKDNNHVRTARAVYCDHCDVCDCDVKACCTIMCALKQSCAHCARCVLLTIVTFDCDVKACCNLVSPARVPSRMK